MSASPTSLNVPQTTVVFLIRDSQVLLGYKKTGFGQGNYLGIGGKVETGESTEAAAHREVKEEINVTDLHLTSVAEITFLFPDQPNWTQTVHAYLCTQWQGEPEESSEIKPQWFNQNELPLNEMWDDARFWLPIVLGGQKVKGIMTFSSDIKVNRIEIKIT